MNEPASAFQRALHARLLATNAFVAMVPPDHLFDCTARPTLFPSVLIDGGDMDAVDDCSVFFDRVVTAIHVWTEEEGNTKAMAITTAIRNVLANDAWVDGDLRVLSVSLTSARFFRDSDGIHAHAILSVLARTLGLA